MLFPPHHPTFLPFRSGLEHGSGPRTLLHGRRCVLWGAFVTTLLVASDACRVPRGRRRALKGAKSLVLR
jgi:hypothetical protein